MKRIETFQQLMLAANMRKSIKFAERSYMSHRPLPAAFVCNMSASVVYFQMKLGMYIYEPAAKRKWGKK